MLTFSLPLEYAGKKKRSQCGLIKWDRGRQNPNQIVQQHMRSQSREFSLIDKKFQILRNSIANPDLSHFLVTLRLVRKLWIWDFYPSHKLVDLSFTIFGDTTWRQGDSRECWQVYVNLIHAVHTSLERREPQWRKYLYKSRLYASS